jgi:hypothetical protein
MTTETDEGRQGGVVVPSGRMMPFKHGPTTPKEFTEALTHQGVTSATRLSA